MNNIIHLSNKGRFDELKALTIGSWDLVAKNKTRCWTSLSDIINVTDNIDFVTCKKCIKMIKKERQNG